MRLSFSMSACKQAISVQPPLINFQGGGLNMDTNNFSPWRRKEKVVVVMGSTGTGKSRLAIDLATSFNAEIINSDKIQVYKGLDIVTNKVTHQESQNVPHHLLGVVEDPDSDFTSSEFRFHASRAMESILSRDRLPIIAGGSNSYVEALINNDEFKFKYECCFIWVDVSLPILKSFVSRRVDKMVREGLVDEVRNFYNPEADNSRGIRRAIGVPELEQFLRSEGKSKYETTKLLEIAVDRIKENTCDLALRQLQKIHRLQYLWGWNLNRIDATDVFLKSGAEADEAWEDLVARPSSMIVGQFLSNKDYLMSKIFEPDNIGAFRMATVAAATR